MIYIYDILLYKSTTNVVGAPASNATDLADFVNNYKATALLVDLLNISENSVEIEVSYAQFKAKIVSPITWADVRYLEGENSYELHLISDNPL